MDEKDPEDGVICAECGEWVLVYTNFGSPGLAYCPCCGQEWEEAHEEGKNEQQ